MHIVLCVVNDAKRFSWCYYENKSINCNADGYYIHAITVYYVHDLY